MIKSTDKCYEVTMKTNPTFRASYPSSTSSSKKNQKTMIRKEKVIQAIFEKSQKQLSSKKKLPKHTFSLKSSKA